MSFPLEDGETGCQSPKLQSAERLHCLQHQLGKYHASAKHCFQRCARCSAFGSSCALGLKLDFTLGFAFTPPYRSWGGKLKLPILPDCGHSQPPRFHGFSSLWHYTGCGNFFLPN